MKNRLYIMGKRSVNKAVMHSIFSNPLEGSVYGVVFQKNGVVRRRISTHKKIVVRKLDK